MFRFTSLSALIWLEDEEDARQRLILAYDNVSGGDGWTHLLALVIQEVGGVDAELRHQRGRRCGHAQPQVDGFGAAERGVVSQSLEGHHGVLRKEKLSCFHVARTSICAAPHHLRCPVASQMVSLFA